MIVHIFCLPMHLFYHMYKRLCIGRHRFHNEKITYTAFITVLWIVYVQIFKTLEWKKLLEIKIIFWVLMKKKLARPPKPVSSSIYIYIYIYTSKTFTNQFSSSAIMQQALACVGDSPHPHCHLHKSRKRRLRQAMKNPSKGKAAWADIAHAKF